VNRIARTPTATARRKVGGVFCGALARAVATFVIAIASTARPAAQAAEAVVVAPEPPPKPASPPSAPAKVAVAGEPAPAPVEPPPRSNDPNAENYRPMNREPRLISGAPPEYPKDFAGSGITAEIMVSMMVDRVGHVSHVRIEDSPDEEFTDAALDALSQWEFLPAIKRGKTTNTPMRLTMLVREEIGDSAYFDYVGGRIALEGTRYASEYEHPVRRLFGLRPAYPFDLLADGKRGEVVVEFTVDDDGIPHDTKIIESTHRDFTLASEGALAHWRFSPAMQKGRTVPVRMRYRISFQPDEFPEALRQMAKSIKAGTNEGLVAPRLLDRQPKALRSLEPQLPTDVNGMKTRHRAVVNIVVNENGDVVLPRVQSASDALSGYIALAAVSYWKFQPGMKNKTPVAVDWTFPISF
jgi:TonB family protein